MDKDLDNWRQKTTKNKGKKPRVEIFKNYKNTRTSNGLKIENSFKYLISENLTSKYSKIGIIHKRTKTKIW